MTLPFALGCELIASPDRSMIGGDAVCGNGIVEDEECDDGNLDQGDGCSHECRIEVCGDGVVNAGEQCDDGAANSTTACGCTADCALPSSGTACADGNLCNGGETCDGAGACVAGSALVCDDSQAGTNDSCVPASGCASLGFTGTTSTTSYGNTGGGTLYADTCPAGQLMIGFQAMLGASFDQIGVVCGVPTVNAALGVDVAAGATLPLRGTIDIGTAASGACPANQMVVGFGGAAGGLLDNLVLRCAPITATYASNAYAVSIGTISDQPGVGGSGGAPFADTDCAVGEVAIGANIRAGGSVDAFGLICSAASIAQ